MTYRVVVSRNPLTVMSDRRIYESAGSAPLISILNHHFPEGGARATVRVNGRFIDQPIGRVIHDGDFVEIVAAADGPVIAVLTPYIGSFFATLIVNLVVAYAYTAVIRAFSSGDEGSLGQRSDAVPVYNVASASNAPRQFGAIPLVLGTMRVFPDVSARPYTEFVNDANAGAPGTGTAISQFYTPTFNAGTWPSYNGSSTRFVEPSPFPSNATALTVNGDSVSAWSTYQTPSVATPHGWVYDTSTGQYSRLAPLENGGVFINDTPPTYTLGYTLSIETPEQTQRLTQIFNLGYGSMLITEPKIRDTEISDTDFGITGKYRGVIFRRAKLRNTESLLDGYPIESDYLLRDDNRFPECIVSENGAGLLQNNDVELDGWIERASPPDTIQGQIDINGRMYAQAGGVIGPISAVIEVEYRATGAGAWTPAPGSPFTLINGDTNFFRYTVKTSYPAAGRYDYRIRQTTQTPTDPNSVIDLEASEFRFQRNFRATDFETRAQNRLGLVVTATAQLNGTIDRLNVYVRCRAWRYLGGAIWDGTTPRNIEPNWSFNVTQNPADWFLYMALGGYYNSDAAGTIFGGLGWHLGPHENNEGLLFGAGLEHSQIDYASIIAFRDYCERENLTFSAYLNDTAAIGEILSKIAAVGRGSWTYQTGKLGIVWEDKSDTVTALFSAANIRLGSFSVAYVSEQLSDSYEGSFTDEAEKRYEQNTVTANRPGVASARSVGKIDLFGVVDESQAQRAVNLAAARTLYQRRLVSFTTGGAGFSTVRGDVIALGHDLTQWAVESRFYGLTLEGDFVRSIELIRPAIWDGSGPLFAQVQLPDGRIVGGEVITFDGEQSTVRLIGDWFAAADAPGVLDQAGTVNALAAPEFETLGPESFFWLMGPTETPGKRLRVVSVRPGEGGDFALTAIDDDPALWSHEYAVGPAVVPDSGEHVPARVKNPMIAPDDAGRLWLSYELDGVESAQVALSIDGAPWTHYGPVSGPRVQLPDYEPGTAIYLSVIPIYDQLAEADPYPDCIYSATLRYTVPEPADLCA